MDDAARKVVRELFRDELSAFEIYGQALASLDGEAREELLRLQRQHGQAAELLRDGDFLDGEAPPSSAGAWGTWQRAVEGTASFFGPKAAIRALKDAEESALADFEGALREEALPPELRSLIAERILPLARGRLPALDGLLERRPGAGSYHSDQGHGPAGAGRGE